MWETRKKIKIDNICFLLLCVGSIHVIKNIIILDKSERNANYKLYY